MRRIARGFHLVAIGTLCLGTICCDNDMSSKVRALRVDNSATASALGIRVGDTIPLSCLQGASNGGPHLFTSCDCEHVHGSITFRSRNALDTNAFVCGHGCVVTVSNPSQGC